MILIIYKSKPCTVLHDLIVNVGKGDGVFLFVRF